MIISNLIKRPIAVSMSLIAIVVIGVLSFKDIPVSLMPDIDVPQITVHVSYPGASVREVDSQVMVHLRNQLQQVAGLENMQSISKMDAGSIALRFEPGSNMDLLFIDVNEKIDRAMNWMPKEIERPKVIKASAMDIPAFYMNISLKTESITKDTLLPIADTRFAQLGDFVNNIVAKRIEQLPQTAMVDISGTIGTEIQCIPEKTKMEALGITNSTLEKAINDNNLTLGVLTVNDGIYRYKIHFDSQIITKEDIENIIINHNGSLYKLKDLCQVVEQPAKREGLVRNGKRNTITLAVIKQNEAQMEDLQNAIQGLKKEFEEQYPDIDFELTRDQTELLTYTIDNLEQNLYVGAILACLILFLFIRNWKLPVLIIITVPITLVVTLLCFYLFNISLNIISLSGLILGIGMIVDNSIIVIDNIIQKWGHGKTLEEAADCATREVFTPMLSSVLTTCSVFIPLIFLNGIAGTLFYDQAMGVTIALFASLLVAVLVIPVYFVAIFRKKGASSIKNMERKSRIDIYKPYGKTLRWVFRNQKTVLTIVVAVIPVTILLYDLLPKERLPYMEHYDVIMSVEWNSGISVEENDKRIAKLLALDNGKIKTSTTMVGVQDFILSHTAELTASEAIVYMKADSQKELEEVQESITEYVYKHYPNAKVSFSLSGNIFDLIFSSDVPDLEIRLQNSNGFRPTITESRAFIDTLRYYFSKVDIQPVVADKDIRYIADIDKMALYGITYNNLFARLQEIINHKSVFMISDGGKSIPIIIGTPDKESRNMLQNTIRNSAGVDIPLNQFIIETKGEDYKNLYSSIGCEYYPIKISADEETVEEIVKFSKEFIRKNAKKYNVSFTGDYFDSRKLIWEMVIVLAVAIALLYFILAAQFESLVQPLLILSEIIVDIFCVFIALFILDESLNIMSLIGLIVVSGIVINDSILKVDTINRLYRSGMGLLKAIFSAGHSRLKPILMTSLTTILAVLPFLDRGDMGSALQYPLSITLIVGMFIGTAVSLFIVPLLYYLIYKKK